MKVVGEVQKIDKYNNLVVNTPSSAAEHLINRYTYYIVINNNEYYFLDSKLRNSTKNGDYFAIVINSKNEILAWENFTSKIKSNYTFLHLLFHSNTIVGIVVYFMFWYATKNNLNLNSKVNLIGIPAVILVSLISIFSGYKKLKAHSELQKSN